MKTQIVLKTLVIFAATTMVLQIYRLKITQMNHPLSLFPKHLIQKRSILNTNSEYADVEHVVAVDTDEKSAIINEVKYKPDEEHSSDIETGENDPNAINAGEELPSAFQSEIIHANVINGDKQNEKSMNVKYGDGSNTAQLSSIRQYISLTNHVALKEVNNKEYIQNQVIEIKTSNIAKPEDTAPNQQTSVLKIPSKVPILSQILFNQNKQESIKPVVNNTFENIMDYIEQKKIINTCKAPGLLKTNVYLLKTHKTGSTSMRNILQRLSFKYNLTMPIFNETHPYPSKNVTKYLKPIRTYWYMYQQLKKNNQTLDVAMINYLRNIPMHEKIKENQCNILTRHSIFVKENAMKLFPSNVTFVANVRHPLKQMASAFSQWNIPFHLGLPNHIDPVSEFLKSPEKYDRPLNALIFETHRLDKHINISYTQNYIAGEFGFNLIRARDRQYIQDYMSEMNETFKVIIITERFAESLILLKREMCWTFQDILFTHLRKKSTIENPTVARENITYGTYSDELLANHKRWSFLDYEIYEMFLMRHRNLVHQGGSLFQQELDAFGYINGLVAGFCSKILPNNANMNYTTDDYIELASRETQIPGTQFSESFIMTGADCIMLNFHERFMGEAYLVWMYPQLCDQEFIAFINQIDMKARSGIYCRHKNRNFKYNLPYSLMAIKCYNCREKYNLYCVKPEKEVTCLPTQACESRFYWKSDGHSLGVIKSCIDAKQCNLPNTNIRFGRSVNYCCFHDLCNQGASVTTINKNHSTSATTTASLNIDTTQSTSPSATTTVTAMKGIKCYNCREKYNLYCVNPEKQVTCLPTQACESRFYWKSDGHSLGVIKSCIDAKQCNLPNTNIIFGRSVYYCCFHDLCNQGASVTTTNKKHSTATTTASLNIDTTQSTSPSAPTTVITTTKAMASPSTAMKGIKCYNCREKYNLYCVIPEKQVTCLPTQACESRFYWNRRGHPVQVIKSCIDATQCSLPNTNSRFGRSVKYCCFDELCNVRTNA